MAQRDEKKVREAAQLLAGGLSQKAVATNLGVQRQTVRRWCNDPDFLEEFESETLRLQREIHARVLRGADKAMSTLEELMDPAAEDEEPRDERIRLGASKAVLTAIGTTRPEGMGSGNIGVGVQTVIVLGTKEGDAMFEGAKARVTASRAKAVLPASARESDG